MKNQKIIVTVIAVVFVFILLLSCFQTIPTGYVGIKTRFGKAQDGIISEGLHFTIPFVERIERIDCRTKKVETYSEASTKDLQTVTTSIAVNYNVDRDSANKLYREVGHDYENIVISPAILESIKASMAGYTAEELITKRSDVSNQIQTLLTEKISDRGFTITEFNITNIDFSDQYDQAIEAKAVKQQEVVTAQAELEKQRIQNHTDFSSGGYPGGNCYFLCVRRQGSRPNRRSFAFTLRRMSDSVYQETLYRHRSSQRISG